MIVPDVNLLLYAHIDGFAQHARARAWWEALLNGDEEVGLCSVAVFGFVRLTTTPRILRSPLETRAALAVVRGWLGRPQVRYLVAGPRYLEHAFALLEQLGVAADLTTDVQIAAHALELNAEVHSHDSDFGRFRGLRWFDPLA